MWDSFTKEVTSELRGDGAEEGPGTKSRAEIPQCRAEQGHAVREGLAWKNLAGEAPGQ